MQAEYATADGERVDPPAVEPPGPADDVLLHAAANRARPAVAMIAAAVRAVDGHGVLSFIMLRPASQPFLC
jgi:hypothetical protein